MLKFLRKYQKIFFIFITAMVVISFCFFGTYGTLTQNAPSADHEMVTGVCGKPLMHREWLSLCRLIEHSPFESASQDHFPNLLNDGVIERDFLSTGLALILVKPYFTEMKGDLDEKVKKVRGYTPYAHPESREAGVEQLWSLFSPSLKEHYEQLKMRSDQATSESLALLCQLYMDQAQLPPAASLKQFLAMQHSQAQLPPDPLLAHADMALFGFHDLSDWFGPKFTPLITSFILNVSQLGEEKGLHVPIAEVRLDLLRNIHQGHARLFGKKTLSSEEAQQYYQAKMHALGLDEPSLLRAWQQVMVCRRFLDEPGVFVDPLAYKQFAHFAQEGVKVNLYELAKPLQFADFLSMLKFQVYLEAIAIDPVAARKTGQIARERAPLETIQHRASALVELPLEISWREVSHEEVAASWSVKETWDWEVQETPWKRLTHHFPSLAAASDVEARKELLESQSPEGRFEIDQAARLMMGEQKERIQALLDRASPKKASVGLRPGGSLWKQLGIEETAELETLLTQTSLQGEEPNEAHSELSFYRTERKTYAIEVITRASEGKLLTFSQSLKEGVLETLLDRLLEKSHLEARKKNPKAFQDEKGKFKPFHEVKEEVGRYLFADLLKAIEYFHPSSDALTLQEYTTARLIPLMRSLKAELEAGATPETLWNEEPWAVFHKAQVVRRSTSLPFAKEGVFALAPGQWSAIQMGTKGCLALYEVEAKEKEESVPLESAQQGHRALSTDARRDLMGQLVRQLHDAKALVLEDHDP